MGTSVSGYTWGATIPYLRAGKLLAVAHTERRGAIRIISARLATRAERKIYEER